MQTINPTRFATIRNIKQKKCDLVKNSRMGEDTIQRTAFKKRRLLAANLKFFATRSRNMFGLSYRLQTVEAREKAGNGSHAEIRSWRSSGSDPQSAPSSCCAISPWSAPIGIVPATVASSSRLPSSKTAAAACKSAFKCVPGCSPPNTIFAMCYSWRCSVIAERTSIFLLSSFSSPRDL